MTGSSVKRVIVAGAESTGGTTLAKALAEKLNCLWVPEYGRDYTATRPGGPTAAWRDEEFRLIAERQNRFEEEAAGLTPNNGWLICDTDAMSTVIWQERYMGLSTQDLRAVAAEQAMPFAHILAGDEIPFEDDGQRDGEHIRHAMQQRFREALAGPEGRGVPWIEVRGDIDARLERAVAFLGGIVDGADL